MTLPHGAKIFGSPPTARGVVGLTGAVGLRMLANRAGLIGSLSQVLARLGFHPFMTDAGC